MFLGFSLFQVTHWITAAGMSLVRYMKTFWQVEHHTNPISEQVFSGIINIISHPLILIYNNKSKWKLP